MKKCSLCEHPEREAIDEALNGGASVREIEARWGVPKSSVARHRAAHLPTPGDVAAVQPSPALAAAYRDLAASARRAFEASMKAGRTQDASNSLRAWETALDRLADLEAPKDAPESDGRPHRGLSDDMARAIMVKTLGLSDEQADRMMNPGRAMPPAAYNPTPVSQLADDAVARFEARTAPPKSEPATTPQASVAPKPPPKRPTPRPRPTGPVRFGGDHTACQCDEDDVDADCPMHAGASEGWARRGIGGII